MTRSRTTKNPWRPLLFVFHPVVLISLALHGLFLLIPLASPEAQSLDDSDLDEEVVAEPLDTAAADPNAAANGLMATGTTDAQADAASANQVAPAANAAALPGTSSPQPLYAQATQARRAAPSAAGTTQSAARQAAAQQTATPAAAATSNSDLPQLSAQSNRPTASGSGATGASSSSSSGSTHTNSAAPSADSANADSSNSASRPAAADDSEASPPDLVSALPEEPPQELLDYIANLRRNYRYRDGNTTSKAAIKSLQTWLDEWEKSAIASSQPAVIKQSTTIPYPLIVCLTPAPETATVAALVNGNGTLIEEPNLLRSTGYRGLNRKALAAVEAMDFPNSVDPTVYTVDVEVDYDRETCTPPVDFIGSAVPLNSTFLETPYGAAGAVGSASFPLVGRSR